ncbi:MAG: adenylyl-sulfate kinase [Casimicrobiaceae bacterium]
MLIGRLLGEADARAGEVGAARGRLWLAGVPGGEPSLRRLVFRLRAADAAIVIADSRLGLCTAARRDLYVAKMLGVRRVVVVADGLDLAGFSRELFESLAAEARSFAAKIGVFELECLPASGPGGDNLTRPSSNLGWYAGPTLLAWLDRQVDPAADDGAVCPSGKPTEVADQFEASFVWVAEEAMLPGRRYRVKIGADTLGATVAQLKYVVDVDTLDHLAARELAQGAIGVGTLMLDAPVNCNPANDGRGGTSFLVVDRLSPATIGAGRIHFALRRSHNLAWQATDVDRSARAASMGHRACVVWFTGLSGAGKSTIANRAEKILHDRGCHTYLLDGDNVRHGLSRDLGFTDADRVENIRRVAEVARLMADAGLVVLVSFISPFRAERRMARALVGPGEFCEVFVDAPLAVAEARDPKGLYAKARRGDLPHFTGIDSPYEPPARPDLHLDSSTLSAEAAAEHIVAWLERSGIVT